MKHCRRYVNTSLKIARQHQHIAFNTRCRRYGIIPRSLRVKPLVDTDGGRRIAARTSSQFLSARIDECYRTLRKLKRERLLQKEELTHAVRPQDLEALESHRRIATDNEKNKAKERQKRKFDTLNLEHGCARRHDRQRMTSSDRLVVNLSSKSLSDAQKRVLAKGLKFAPAPKSIPVKEIVMNVESGLRGVPQQAADEARVRIVSLLKRARPPPRNTTREEESAIRTLKDDTGLIILPADKGNATVVLDRDEYDKKVERMLDDQLTYEKIKKDPAPSLERRMNAKLLALNRKGSIPDRLYERLRSSNGKTPLLYGLPKVHKPEVPLRPIASFVHSPTYQLSKHLSQLLSPLVGKSPSAVRNSKGFANFIAEQSISDDELLVSFDVISLFTNVPTELAVDVARKRLLADETLEERTVLEVDEIVMLLRLCLDATFVCFREKYYRQTFGTAMGSPVSVTVANLVMEEVEQTAISTYHKPPRFWKRYVDDTCTVLPKGSVHEFHRHLNGVNRHIQFTVEEEKDGCLPFLDILLTRDVDGSIQTAVYRKKTHTDRYLDFSSHHPLSHKRSVAATLLRRARDLSSNAVNRSKEETHVVSALRSNGYPRRFIQRSNPPTSQPNHQTDDGTESDTQEEDSTKKPPTVTLPYVRGLSETIKRLMEKMDVRVQLRPNRTLRQMLVKPKDPVPLDQRNGVVYRIPCKDCESTYVGQSGRSLACRMKEHQRAVRGGDTNASAIAEHAWGKQHQIDWGAAEVLDTNPSWRPRCLLESWHIHKEPSTMNRDRGNLPQIYCTLLRTD